eukprot:m.192845 g.192845  ORF g.192845 m.192845 type:complete len:808 (-) comp32486_c0_seq1:486-2909(-)
MACSTMMFSVFISVLSSANSQITVDVDPSNVTHQINPLFMGCHSDSGFTHEPRGFYAQMVLGESFEQLPPQLTTKGAPGLGPTSVKNAKNGGFVRHCSFQLYSDDHPDGIHDDFVWNIVKGLDGTPDSISLQSTNYNTKYITAIKGLEAGRAGIDVPATPTDATFTVMPALSGDANGFSLVSNSASMKGMYLAINDLKQGACAGSYDSNTKDVAFVAPTVIDKEAATWLLAVLPGPPPPPPQLSSWNEFTSPGVQATFEKDTTAPFHGMASQKITFASGQGVAAVGNRGLGNEGLFIEANKDYNGYFFAKSDAPVMLVAQIINKNTNMTLGSTTIKFAGGNWTMLNFTLNTTAGTECVDGTNDTTLQCGHMGPASHICVSCGGQFQVGLAEAGEVNIDYVYMQPGSWGTFAGLGVLKSGVDTLSEMGITTIRLGGSFTDPEYYFWKNWIGKPWDRPSLGAEWGKELISGWGPFEFIDMCNAAGIEPVMTTTGVCTLCQPEDMGDLIEYAHGNESTAWGKRRFTDGHPKPYNVTWFELGNEQYNPMYADQVAAMESRAAGLGMANTMFYMNPNNARWLNPADAAKVEKVGIKDHAVMDEHVGGGGGVEIAKNMFAKFPNYTMGAVNAETNAGIHTMSRAMMEANDLNDWFNCADPWCTRLHFRTASFCTERSGHFDAFDQGISFFLPNMSWIQPPGYVHKMIANTWSAKALPATLVNGDSVSAQLSDDGKSVLIRLATTTGGSVQLTFKGKAVTGNVKQTTISSADLDDANPPSDPTHISPQSITYDITLQGGATVPDNSFSVFEVSL